MKPPPDPRALPAPYVDSRYSLFDDHNGHHGSSDDDDDGYDGDDGDHDGDCGDNGDYEAWNQGWKNAHTLCFFFSTIHDTS